MNTEGSALSLILCIFKGICNFYSFPFSHTVQYSLCTQFLKKMHCVRGNLKHRLW